MNQPPKILIVDDTPENIHTLGAILSEYKRIAATSGEKALLLAKKQPTPDLILLDIVMPGIDGYEVCKALKSSSETKSIPIVFTTSKTEPEEIQKGLELGAIDYITKPFDADELNQKIQKALSA